MPTSDRCVNCVNYLGELSCLAFDRIPDEILTGENDHSKPLRGQDNDFIYSDSIEESLRE